MKKTEKKFLTFNLFVYILIIIAAILIYANSLYCEFQFDDEAGIVNNAKIRDLNDCIDLSRWKNINARPLTVLSFALNYHFNALQVFGYHFVNLTIHIITGCFVFLLVTLILSLNFFKEDTISKYRKYIGLLVALIIIAHPVQTQAVTYIVQRMTSLAAMFYIMSVYFYIKGRILNIKSGVSGSVIVLYITAILTGLLGFLSKQNAVTFPLAMLLSEFFFIRNKANKPYKKYLIFSTAIISIIFLAIAFSNILPPHAEKISKTDYLITQFRVIMKYIQLLFLPVQQNVDYDFTISRTLWGIKEIGSFLAILIIIFIGIFTYNKKRLLSFGIFWFLLTLSVESSIIPIRDVIVEHRLYLPMFGFGIFIVSLLWYIFTSNRQKYFFITLSLIVLAYGVLSFKRNQTWKTKYTLWSDAVKKSPGKARPYNNLGYTYWLNKDYENATKCYNKALEISPNYTEALNNLGLIYYQRNAPEEAIKCYHKVLAINPDHAHALNNIGLAWQDIQEYDIALQYYNKALYKKPNFVEALYNIGNVWQIKGDFDKAVEYYNKVLFIKPDYINALYNLGNIWSFRKKSDTAIEYYEKAIGVKPDFTDAINNLGNIWYIKGDKNKAKQYYEQVLKIDPSHKEALNNLKILLQKP